jgi:hypothetical protein
MKDREREKKEGGGWLVGIYQDIFIHAFTKEWIKPIGMIKSPKKEKREPKSRSQIRGPTRWLSLFFFFFFLKNFYVLLRSRPDDARTLRAPFLSLEEKKTRNSSFSPFLFLYIFIYIHTHTHILLLLSQVAIFLYPPTTSQHLKKKTLLIVDNTNKKLFFKKRKKSSSFFNFN